MSQIVERKEELTDFVGSTRAAQASGPWQPR